MNDLQSGLNKLLGWQYLNVATFAGVVAILVILLV